VPFNKKTIYKLHDLQVLQAKKDVVLANFSSYSYPLWLALVSLKNLLK
jgi:hypothetical protein